MNPSKPGLAVAASLCLAVAAPARGTSDLVVSQIYGGAGTAASTYDRDFVELFNRGSTPVSLAGLSVQYASATGTGNFAVGANLPGTMLAPGQYFLVGMAPGAGISQLPTPDASGNTAMAGTTGKVALVQGTSALACNGGSTPCSAPQLAQIVDLVGYGTADFFDGTGPAPILSVTRSARRDDNGCMDTDQNGADFTAGEVMPRNSASPASPCVASTEPLLSVADVAGDEGDAGNTTFLVTVRLDRPAGPSGVTFRYVTVAGTATSSDFVEAMGQRTIGEGSTETSVPLMVKGDVAPEPDETFLLRITQVTNAVLHDGEGTITIRNDDQAELSIAEVQGAAATSSARNAVVTVEGIVTAHKFNNGFFLQTPDAEADGNPATSEGIFVFTSTAPPASAAVGNRVRVTGTVSEYTPAGNPHQMPITQIVSPTIGMLSTGNALPTPVVLGPDHFSATATPTTAERLEGMRVTLAAGVVVAPAEANISEAAANATTTGVFHVVLDGVARPFREPGVSLMTAIPFHGGKFPEVFDANQERLMVRSRGQVGAAAIAVDTGATVTGMTGVMDYFAGTWALLPDAGSGTVAGGAIPHAVAAAQAGEATIAGFNLLRFYDDINDGNGAATLTPAGLDKRLTKTAWAICDYLKTPDIIGVVEAENLHVLGLLADRIGATCAAAPDYAPYLVQGNDPGGINVGFLVNTKTSGGIPRVEVHEVIQLGKNALFANPDGTTSLLNDRPPLLMRATITPAGGAPYPVTLIVNHLRSLNGSDDIGAGSNGWETEGHRVRAKRARQAEFLASRVQSRQTADPTERIVLLGDFNAFEFNDALTDVMGIITGLQAPSYEVLEYLPSPVTLPLTNLTPGHTAGERYSYSFEGNAQTLDHIVVNQAILDRSSGVRIEHARINADFGGDNYGDPAVPVRVSDHDPVVLYLPAVETGSADLQVFVGGISQATAGKPVAWEVAIQNNGPAVARGITVDIRIDAELPYLALAPPADMSCGLPVIANGETLATCRMTLLATAQPDLARIGVASMPDAGQAGTLLTLSAEVSAINPDGNSGNNSAWLHTLLTSTQADLALEQLDASPSTTGADGALRYRVLNLGPESAAKPRVELTVAAAKTKVVPNAPDWSCESVQVDAATQRWTCDFAYDELHDGSSSELRFELHAQGSTVVTAGAIVSSTTDDPNNLNDDETSTHVIMHRSTR